jgi:serine/threonine protein kinase
MLKKNPKERITAHQALAHSYFEEINEVSDVMGGTSS